jgi:putative SOS response-associated peptidase YedK
LIFAFFWILNSGSWLLEKPMCGRFVQTTLFPILKSEFNLASAAVDFRARYNIAPTQEVPTVIRKEENELVMCRWGLIPHWAKDISIGNKMINARAETLSEKPSFKGPFKKHRCLVIADGFYEWKKTESGKIPVYIHLKDDRPIGFAGLTAHWSSPEGQEITSCTIVTTAANSLLETVHDRMPAIIAPEHREMWLDPDVQDTEKLSTLLGPYSADEMEMWEVSKRVNSPANEGAENIEPL